MAEAAFRAAIAELGAVILGGYRTSHAKVHVRCAAGHDCYPAPHTVQRGRGICLTCAGLDPVVAEARFRARLAELGATPLYDEYRGGQHGHLAICAAGHTCYPRPAGVQQGEGPCLTCGGKDPAVAEAAFRARLAELGAELLEPYVNSKTSLRVRCAAGHECRPWPGPVVAGVGICRVCAGKDWDIFYVVAGSGVVKFGITSRDPRPRLRVHALQGYTEVVRLAVDLPGTIAPDTECAVRSALALAGERPVQGREYFDASCLALILDVADSWLGTPAEAAELEWVQEELFAA